MLLQPSMSIGSSSVGHVGLENGIDPLVVLDLETRGHDVTFPVTGYSRVDFGRGHCTTTGAWWLSDDVTGAVNNPNVYWAGSDMRGDGLAVGY